MPSVSVRIEGLDALINFTKQVSIRMPIEANKLNAKLARNTEQKAKQFLRIGIPQKGQCSHRET